MLTRSAYTYRVRTGALQCVIARVTEVDGPDASWMDARGKGGKAARESGRVCVCVCASRTRHLHGVESPERRLCVAAVLHVFARSLHVE